jgi:hypothetical protein
VSAVANVGCKNVGVMTIVMRAMTTGVALLGIQSGFVLYCCHLLLNVIELTPALTLSTTINIDSSLA